MYLRMYAGFCTVYMVLYAMSMFAFRTTDYVNAHTFFEPILFIRWPEYLGCLGAETLLFAETLVGKRLINQHRKSRSVLYCMKLLSIEDY